MRFPHLRLAAMLRSRSAALAVGAAVLVTVVAANQPHDEVLGHPQSAAAASTVRADHRTASPPLRTLQRRVEFGDASASHAGAPRSPPTPASSSTSTPARSSGSATRTSPTPRRARRSW